jgi:hypothetical protein
MIAFGSCSQNSGLWRSRRRSGGGAGNTTERWRDKSAARCGLVRSCVFRGLMASFSRGAPDRRSLRIRRFLQGFPRLRDVQGLGHERRGRFPHPAWPHPLDPARSVRGPSSPRRSPPRRRPAAASRAPARSAQGQSLAFGRGRAPACRPTGSDQPIAQHRHQDPRRPPHRPRAPLSAHLSYLRREGVTRDGEKAHLFGPETEDADAKSLRRALRRTTGIISASSSRPRTRRRCPTSRPSPAS